MLAILFQHANSPLRPRFRNADWSSSLKWAKRVPTKFLKAQPEAAIAFTIFFCI